LSTDGRYYMKRIIRLNYYYILLYCIAFAMTMAGHDNGSGGEQWQNNIAMVGRRYCLLFYYAYNKKCSTIGHTFEYYLKKNINILLYLQYCLLV